MCAYKSNSVVTVKVTIVTTEHFSTVTVTVSSAPPSAPSGMKLNHCVKGKT